MSLSRRHVECNDDKFVRQHSEGVDGMIGPANANFCGPSWGINLIFCFVSLFVYWIIDKLRGSRKYRFIVWSDGLALVIILRLFWGVNRFHRKSICHRLTSSHPRESWCLFKNKNTTQSDKTESPLALHMFAVKLKSIFPKIFRSNRATASVSPPNELNKRSINLPSRFFLEILRQFRRI